MVFKNLSDLIMTNSVTFGISVAIISASVNQLLFSFINDMILPIFDTDASSENDPNINKLNELVIPLYNVKFKVGSFIIAIIRFIMLIIILLIVSLIVIKKK